MKDKKMPLKLFLGLWFVFLGATALQSWVEGNRIASQEAACIAEGGRLHVGDCCDGCRDWRCNSCNEYCVHDFRSWPMTYNDPRDWRIVLMYDCPAYAEGLK